MPSEVGVGETARFSLRGELIRLPHIRIPNFAVALWYEDGPQDSVKVVIGGREYLVRKKTGLADTRPVYVGAVITISGTVKLEATGTYVFKGLAGYADVASGTFYVDAVDEKRVTTRQPSVPAPAPTPTPTPTPAPEIPWWPIAIAGALVAVVAVVGVAIAMEREKQMMLMMALTR
jgi:hypothetical protein